MTLIQIMAPSEEVAAKQVIEKSHDLSSFNIFKVILFFFHKKNDYRTKILELLPVYSLKTQQK